MLNLFFEQIMDERWESEVVEYGAINITGFRIVDVSKPYVKEFLEGNFFVYFYNLRLKQKLTMLFSLGILGLSINIIFIIFRWQLLCETVQY